MIIAPSFRLTSIALPAAYPSHVSAPFVLSPLPRLGIHAAASVAKFGLYFEAIGSVLEDLAIEAANPLPETP